MPPRLNKRQLREQEELAALEAAETPDLSHGQGASEESDHEIVPVVATGFAAVSLHHLYSCVWMLTWSRLFS